MMTLRLRAMLAACALLLAGCGDGDVKEVQEWMAQTRAQARPTVQPIAAPKTFVPVAYTARDAVDPFNPQKLLVELARAASNSNSPFKPDQSRPKELLENFPLDTMHMVGFMQKGGVNYALVQIDRAVYQVKTGQHLGQNYGLVTRVTDTAVNIRETVQDATGDWVQREATLELQQSKEKTK